MKQAKIYYKDILAGLLTEGDDGYEFYYLPECIESENAKTGEFDFAFTERSVQK